MQGPWISRAQDALSASGARLPAMSGVGLLAALGAAAAERADAERAQRVERLLTHLLEAPPPAAEAVRAALQDESERVGYAQGGALAAAYAPRTMPEGARP